ncbi:MAG: sulfatase-like hydrolase/transferase [Reichenbachiella sp.]|uniref:sulfatase-like hydrolase/transferase n=1 Tax=Reichenbachiella sp. TaxID=2184521 RepID=UPI0029675638|nr:sulfatase-like hydrolase/transferase [Reichenbachiella sp.]MDW3210384.1 sulfatase-like hydrolase/transferase [Reichenbachiella sp.]
MKTISRNSIISLFLITSIVSYYYSCTQLEEQQLDTPSSYPNPSLKAQPNILWIVAEDLSSYIPAFGDSTVVTPNLDKLAKSGVCYDNFYSPHPVCAPARASIITGMYANSIGASHMRTGPWYAGAATAETISKYNELQPDGLEAYEAVPPAEVKMFTEYLRAAGYYCTNNSKEDYQMIKTPTAWDDSSNEAHWRNRPKDVPFFSVFNLMVTHESKIWAKANDSLLVDANLEIPIPPYLPDTEIAKNDIRRMYSNILKMDSQVGEILHQLESDGLLDNTIVFWCTDHGGPLPRQKRLLYESGLEVPAIVRFPNEQLAGQRDDRLISFVDLAPTMLSIAGIQPPKHMQGQAFLGKYARQHEPEYLFAASDRFDEYTDRIRSVRDQRYKYIQYLMPEQPMYADIAYRNQMPIMQELKRLQASGELTPEQALWFRDSKPTEELFDLENDPHELNNLAEVPKYADKLKELRTACNEWKIDIKDTGLIPEKELIARFKPNGIQPQTAQPVIQINDSLTAITCTTEGASIGYKLYHKSENPDRMSWSVYTKPFTISEEQELQVIAHRMGYQPSEIEVYAL